MPFQFRPLPPFLLSSSPTSWPNLFFPRPGIQFLGLNLFRIKKAPPPPFQARKFSQRKSVPSSPQGGVWRLICLWKKGRKINSISPLLLLLLTAVSRLSDLISSGVFTVHPIDSFMQVPAFQYIFIWTFSVRAGHFGFAGLQCGSKVISKQFSL